MAERDGESAFWSNLRGETPTTAPPGTGTSALVPFGKHKGQPVEILLADPGYRDWLLAQPWVRDRYPTFHQVIINYGAEPAETPEHNQMQAAFLDDGRCFALARLLWPRRSWGLDAVRVPAETAGHLAEFSAYLKREDSPAEIVPRRFEHEGWDVAYGIVPASVDWHVTSLPPCTCAPCDHGGCREDASCHGGTLYCDHQRCSRKSAPEPGGRDAGWHCDESCLWAWGRSAGRASWLLADHDSDREAWPSWDGQVLAELKPDLGDDYPAVLRQVKRYPSEHGDRRVVVARRLGFTSVTRDQVTEIFAASGITLIAESDISHLEDPC